MNSNEILSEIIIRCKSLSGKFQSSSNFLTNERGDSFYSIQKRGEQKPVQIRLSNHGTYLKTWVDRENLSDSKTRLLDPAHCINISIVFLDEGNNLTNDCIGQNNCNDCQIIPCIPQTFEGQNEIGRPFTVNQFVYNSKYINNRNLNGIVRAIINALKQGIYKDPLIETVRKASPKELKSNYTPQSASIDKKKINENKEYKTNKNISKNRIRITENELKHIVTEVIRKIMSGGNYKNIYDITFVSYGTNEFSKDKFIPPFMRDDINKPQHGFWGSPIDSLNGWGEWCDRENFYTYKLDKHVLFKIKKGSNIYIIDTQEDLDKISKNEDIEDMIQTIKRRFKCSYEEAKNTALKFYHNSLKKIIDFKYLYKHYDGIFVTERAVKELSNVNNGDGLYWWDVESICVFNPDIIEVIKENAFDKAKVPSYINDDYLDNGYMDDDYEYDDGNKVTNKMRQINKSYELYGNRNIDSDSSHLFNGKHPGILAQGHGNNKNTKLARKYNGTIKSGLDENKKEKNIIDMAKIQINENDIRYMVNECISKILLRNKE